jgi:hypothetical protein
MQCFASIHITTGGLVVAKGTVVFYIIYHHGLRQNMAIWRKKEQSFSRRKL